jgi:hypothetical protein
MAYGSLMNVLASGSVEAKAAPTVGAGVTELSYTDRRPGTISRVSASGKTFWYRDDRVAVVGEANPYGRQEWEIARDDSAPETKVTLRKDGVWRNEFGRAVLVGVREMHYDYNF